MTVITEDFEAGVAVGTDITTLNSTFDGNIAPTAGTPTFKFTSTGIAFGTLGARIVGASTVDVEKPYIDIGADVNAAAIRFYVYFNSLPSASNTFFAFKKGATGSFGNMSSCGLNAANKFVVSDAAGTNTTSSYTFLVNTLYRIEAYHQVGTTTGNGTLQFDVYVGAGTTPVYSFAQNGTANTLGSTAGAQLRQCGFGKFTAAAALDVTFDQIKIDTARTTNDIGPYTAPANVAPVIAQPARVQMAAPGSVTVSFNATDSDGTIASGGVSWVSGPTPAATVGPTFTPSTSGLNTASTTFSATFTAGAGRYTLAANCVDNSGAAATQKTWIVDVPAASTADVQAENVIAAAYANVGGAASIAAACRDTLATTYGESPATPAGEIARATYLPFPVGNIVIDCYNYNSASTPPISVQATVYKEDGTTQVYQTSFTAPTAVPGAATPVTIDSAGMALLTGVNDTASLVLRRALVVDFAPTQ